MTNPYEYTTDSYGRIKSVTGKLQSIRGKRNKYAQANAGREDRRKGNLDEDYNDDGGHLIATIFNGDGDFANLVPMNRELNHSAWKKMENAWDKLLKAGCEVEIDINIDYENNKPLRPHFFSVYTIVTNSKNGKTRDTIFEFENEIGQPFDERKKEKLLEVLQ